MKMQKLPFLLQQNFLWDRIHVLALKVEPPRGAASSQSSINLVLVLPKIATAVEISKVFFYKITSIEYI